MYAQRFERGKPVDDLHIIADREGHGTLIRFQADPEIFSETTEYEYDVLATPSAGAGVPERRAVALR